MTVSISRLAALHFLVAVALCAVPTSSTLADQADTERFRDYHRRHVFELALDAYRGRQTLPEQQIVETDEALRQLAATLGLPCSVTWIGHSTFLLRIGDLYILTDPIFSSHASPLPPLGPRRLAKPGIRLKNLPRIDAIILSHSHYDHADFPTLQRLARRDKRTIAFAPQALSRNLSEAGFTRIVTHKPGQRSRLGPLRLTSVAVGHKTGRNFQGNDQGFAHCWRMDDPDVRFFFCGDTPYGPEFQKTRQTHGNSDIALLPIGAYTPRWFEKHNHVDPDEAVRIGLDLGADTVIAGHWGTFALTPEPVLAPAKRFMKNPSPGIDKVVLKIGETFVHSRLCRCRSKASATSGDAAQLR